jgi:FAD:protein FMN transferase
VRGTRLLARRRTLAMASELVSRHFDALGSTCELLSLSATQAALERCEAQLREAEGRFTRFLPESELARLNAGDGRYLPVSPQMFDMLEAAVWAYVESGGLVNAAAPHALPEVLILERATRAVALAPGAALDLGGIFKGVLADLLIDQLGDDAVCDLGGDVRVRGRGVDGDGWHIPLCDLSVVVLADGAVCTSGVGRRRWGPSPHHLIDPRTGMPARTDLAEVSVVTDGATRGELYARTAILLGATAGIAFLEAKGVHYAMVPAVTVGAHPATAAA